jgi:hypothetical protein
VPVKAMVPKREPTVAETAAVENMSGVKSAAMEHGTTAVETAAMETTTMEAAAAVKSASAPVKSTSPATMPTTAMTAAAADFGRQPVRDVCCDRHGAGIDRRKRLCALAGRRQHQRRGSRKAQRTDEATDAAPWIWNPRHA